MKTRLQGKVSCGGPDLRAALVEDAAKLRRMKVPVADGAQVNVGEPISCDVWFDAEVEVEMRTVLGGMYSLDEVCTPPRIVELSSDAKQCQIGKDLVPLCDACHAIGVERKWFE